MQIEHVKLPIAREGGQTPIQARHHVRNDGQRTSAAGHARRRRYQVCLTQKTSPFYILPQPRETMVGEFPTRELGRTHRAPLPAPKYPEPRRRGSGYRMPLSCVQPAVAAPQAKRKCAWTPRFLDLDGLLDAGGARLRLAINIIRDRTGPHVATLDSPDRRDVNSRGSGGAGSDSPSPDLEALGAVYEATVDPPTARRGHWTQRGGGLCAHAAAFGTSADAGALRRPQEPARPVPMLRKRSAI
jgi:hypothetical protein